MRLVLEMSNPIDEIGSTGMLFVQTEVGRTIIGTCLILVAASI